MVSGPLERQAGARKRRKVEHDVQGCGFLGTQEVESGVSGAKAKYEKVAIDIDEMYLAGNTQETQPRSSKRKREEGSALPVEIGRGYPAEPLDSFTSVAKEYALPAEATLIYPSEYLAHYGKIEQESDFALQIDFETQAQELAIKDTSNENLQVVSTISWYTAPQAIDNPWEDIDCPFPGFTLPDDVLPIDIGLGCVSDFEAESDSGSFDWRNPWGDYCTPSAAPVDQLAEVSRRTSKSVRARSPPRRFKPEVRCVEERRGAEEGDVMVTTGLGRDMVGVTLVSKERVERDNRHSGPANAWLTALAPDAVQVDENRRVLRSSLRGLESAKQTKEGPEEDAKDILEQRLVNAAKSPPLRSVSLTTKSSEVGKKHWLSRKIHPLKAKRMPMEA